MPLMGFLFHYSALLYYHNLFCHVSKNSFNFLSSLNVSIVHIKVNKFHHVNCPVRCIILESNAVSSCNRLIKTDKWCTLAGFIFSGRLECIADLAVDSHLVSPSPHPLHLSITSTFTSRKRWLSSTSRRCITFQRNLHLIRAACSDQTC